MEESTTQSVKEAAPSAVAARLRRLEKLYVKDISLDVLRHRVSISYEAEAENITSEQIIAKIIEELPVP